MFLGALSFSSVPCMYWNQFHPPTSETAKTPFSKQDQICVSIIMIQQPVNFISTICCCFVKITSIPSGNSACSSHLIQFFLEENAGARIVRINILSVPCWICLKEQLSKSFFWQHAKSIYIINIYIYIIYMLYIYIHVYCIIVYIIIYIHNIYIYRVYIYIYVLVWYTNTAAILFIPFVKHSDLPLVILENNEGWTSVVNIVIPIELRSGLVPGRAVIPTIQQ